MLGDYSMCLWQFKWPTFLVWTGWKLPSKHFCYQSTQCFPRCLSSQERCAIAGDVGLSHLLTWGAGTRASRGAGSTRTACTTQSDTAAGLCQHGLCDLREAQCTYESSEVQWRCMDMMDTCLVGIQPGGQMCETTCGCPAPPCCNYWPSAIHSLQDF